jgi:hypothetical protein
VLSCHIHTTTASTMCVSPHQNHSPTPPYSKFNVNTTEGEGAYTQTTRVVASDIRCSTRNQSKIIEAQRCDCWSECIYYCCLILTDVDFHWLPTSFIAIYKTYAKNIYVKRFKLCLYVLMYIYTTQWPYGSLTLQESKWHK